MQYFPDRFVRREIQALDVWCKFRDDGCEWEGKYAELKSHLADCKYSLKGMKLCPLEPLGCSSRRSMDDNEMHEHLQESEYDHLTMLVNCIQLLTKKVQGQNLLLDKRVEPDGADHGYETMDVPGYQRLPISYHDMVEKDGGMSGMTTRTRGAPLSLPGKQLYTAALEVPGTVGTLQLREMVTKEVESVKDKLLSSMMESLNSNGEEIASLRTQITKLEKQIRSKNAELEDRDFRLSLIENSNHDGSMIWKIPQFLSLIHI